MRKRRSNRLQITVSREMTIALEVLSSKSGLAASTQALVVLRQGLDRTITSDAVQTRLAQERAFRSRDEWLADTGTETFLSNALRTADGAADDAPPR